MTIQLRQCIRAAQRGDKLAAEEVIRAFKPFLNKQAKQYQKQYRRHYHNFMKPFLLRIKVPCTVFFTMI